jgi:hypothetical protein
MAQPQIPPEQLSVLAKEDLGPLMVTVVVVFTVIAFISVCLRFFTRLAVVRHVGPEDYFIALSMVNPPNFFLRKTPLPLGKMFTFLKNEALFW